MLTVYLVTVHVGNAKLREEIVQSLVGGLSLSKLELIDLPLVSTAPSRPFQSLNEELVLPHVFINVDAFIFVLFDGFFNFKLVSRRYGHHNPWVSPRTE